MDIGVERSSPPARKLLSRRGYHGAIRPVDPGVLLRGFFITLHHASRCPRFHSVDDPGRRWVSVCYATPGTVMPASQLV